MVIIFIISFIVILIFLSTKNRELFNNKNNNLELSPNLSKKDIEDIKKGQKLMTDMFREFDRICRKYKLKYWCHGGTLLGVIRHKGWIPWDGDIDVNMPESDYKQLQNIIKKELPNELWFQDNTVDKYYKSDIGKIRILNSNYKDYKDRSWHNGLQLDIFINRYRDGIYTNFVEGYKFKREAIFPLKEKMFDNIKVFVPNNYKYVLEKLFNKDYMVYLPLNKRIPHEGRMELVAPTWMKEKYSELYK